MQSHVEEPGKQEAERSSGVGITEDIGSKCGEQGSRSIRLSLTWAKYKGDPSTGSCLDLSAHTAKRAEVGGRWVGAATGGKAALETAWPLTQPETHHT